MSVAPTSARRRGHAAAAIGSTRHVPSCFSERRSHAGAPGVGFAAVQMVFARERAAQRDLSMPENRGFELVPSGFFDRNPTAE